MTAVLKGLRAGALWCVVAANSGCNIMAGVNGGIGDLVARAQVPAQVPLHGSGPSSTAALNPLQPPAPVQPGSSPTPVPATVPPPNRPPTGDPILQTSASRAVPQVRVVAVIGADQFITDDEVWAIVRQLVLNDRTDPYTSLTPDQIALREQKLFDESLRRLIEREIILGDFLARLKKNKPSAIEDLYQEANKRAQLPLREFKRQNKIPDEETLIKALAYQGINYKLLVRQLERDSMLNLYLESFLRDKGKTISGLEVERYYKDHPEEFRTETKWVWRHLFVSSVRVGSLDAARQTAEQLRAQAVAGADFVELVKQHGHGDSALRQGQGIGSKPGEIQPVYLEPVLKPLSAGEISPLFPTELGYHIVQMVEREDAGIRPFDEKTQSYIRRKLTLMLQEQERQKLVEQLARQTTVRIIPPNAP